MSRTSRGNVLAAVSPYRAASSVSSAPASPRTWMLHRGAVDGPRMTHCVDDTDVWSNRRMLETPGEIDRLQQLLDRSAAGAGPHLRGIITDNRRLSAERLCELLQGMRLLVVATVTADGRPLAGPVDGYLLHGMFYFSSGRDSVRMRHLASRPAVSATSLAGDELAVTVHGRAELFDVSDPARGELRQAMLDYYLPSQGPAFETWLDQAAAVAAPIAADKMFTHTP